MLTYIQRQKQGGLRAETMPSYGNPYQQQAPAYGHAQAAMPPVQAMPPTGEADPYAAYGGYQNYMAMWTAALANQGGYQQGPPGR